MTTHRKAKFTRLTLTGTPTDLLYGGMIDPTGITDPAPKRFAARYNDERDYDYATAYCLQVSTDDEFSEIYYDSGKRRIFGSVFVGEYCPDILYHGPAFAVDTVYYWRIKFLVPCGYMIRKTKKASGAIMRFSARVCLLSCLSLSRVLQLFRLRRTRRFIF